MNLKQALYITTIAETGNISKAAKMLYVSQPSLSQMLKQVEDEIGLKLFDRSTSPFRTTYAGEVYIEAARTMLAANEHLEYELKAIRDEDSGRLRVGISVSRGIQILPYVIPVFRKMYPRVQIELTECGSTFLETKLKNDEIDLALAAIASNDPALTYQMLEKETMGIITGPACALAKKYEDGTSITIADLQGIPFVTLNRNHSSRTIQDRFFASKDFQPDVLLEVDSLDLARQIVIKSDACILLPHIYCNDIIRKEGAHFYPLADSSYEHHFYACYRQNSFVPRYTKDFIDVVIKAINGDLK